MYHVAFPGKVIVLVSDDYGADAGRSTRARVEVIELYPISELPAFIELPANVHFVASAKVRLNLRGSLP